MSIKPDDDETICCPACGKTKPYYFATSRYTHKPICDDCATREAFEGPFWPAAALAWSKTEHVVRAAKAHAEADKKRGCEVKYFFVTQRPKQRYRGTFSSSFLMVEAKNGKAAITKALTDWPEYFTDKTDDMMKASAELAFETDAELHLAFVNPTFL